MESAADAKETFGRKYFGQANLGDKRRVERLVSLTDCAVQRSGGTLPQKLVGPGDLDALYRMCKREEVTHQALMASVQQHVLAEMAEMDGSVLVLHDSTEFDYSTRKSLTDSLGQIGNGKRRGLIGHHSLAYDPQRGEVIGLVNQILYRREVVDKTATRAENRERKSRESLLWLQGTEPLSRDWRIIDVCDRGADTFEFIEHECRSGRRFIIRSHHDRAVLVGHEPEVDDQGATNERKAKLHKHAEQAQALGGYTLEIRTKPPSIKKKKNGKPVHPGRSKRIAKLMVSATPVRLLPPNSPRGQHSQEPLPVWIVRVWEPEPPANEERIEWFLITNHPAETLAPAIKVVHWYACRWVIEEYHKAQKTGVGIQQLQLRSLDRLEPVICWLSVVAVTLLRLRDAARAPDATTRPASDILDVDYVEVLSQWRHNTARTDLTVHEFIMALGKLGGHRNRKGDGLPGWITLWRGWTELVGRVDAVRRDRRRRERCAYS